MDQTSPIEAEIRGMLAAHRDVEAVERLAAFPVGDRDRAVLALLQDIATTSQQPMARARAAEALVETRPGDVGLWRFLAHTAFNANDFRLASHAMGVASASPASQPSDFIGAAMAAYLDNDLDRASRFYERAAPGSVAAACGLADIALARGDRERAGAILDRAFSLHPASPDVLAALSRLRSDDTVMAGLERAVEQGADQERMIAGFALAQSLDRRGRFEAAFARAAAANAISRSMHPPYRPDADAAAASAMLSLFDALKEGDVEESDAIRPILIVGMPRSGTSIVESLLAAHPDVDAGGERMDMALVGRELEIAVSHGGVDAGVEALRRRGGALGRSVIERARAAGLSPRAYTDKLPLNDLYVGVIARLFPAARFIHVRRDPRETALSMYLLNFAGAYPYATDLDDLATAVRQHDHLMEGWRARLPERILEVRLEELSRNPDAQGRRLFDFLGLEWSPAFASVENRTAPTRTFSALQVREPIRETPPRWPGYKPWIAPLLAAFGET